MTHPKSPTEPAAAPTAKAATITIAEAKCACGASHFRLGATRCFACETADPNPPPPKTHHEPPA